MRYCIAIDSGGTKTDAVLFNTDGEIIYRDISAGCNGMDIGKAEACVRMERVISRMMKHSPEIPIAIYGGIAGTFPLGDFHYQYLRPLIPEQTKLRIDDDGCSLISGMLGHSNGCGMVCGTGSSMFIRIEGEPLRKVGGKGYLIDTGGSGFELGRDVLCAAFRADDGRTKDTVLTDLILKKTGKSVHDMMPDIYDPERGGRAYIASFAHLVFEGYRMDDWACREIFEKGARLLGDLTYAAERYFDDTFTVVMGGGIVSSFPEYVQAIREYSSKKASLILGDVPPVYGAAAEAVWDGGLEVDAQFRKNFLRDYRESKNLRRE